ncbi:hypothetical protein H6P81_020781 [Aristolochia fimbriata]|uniref:VQ domain-containing protein n=1 Tax=Aristolochia fimbriata TaxID=158543 RepID=A0AAV7DWI9_ARIFI|nr:hypothetical protein H6P81_020781 [Aristolochia fimbriata]
MNTYSSPSEVTETKKEVMHGSRRGHAACPDAISRSTVHKMSISSWAKGKRGTHAGTHCGQMLLLLNDRLDHVSRPPRDAKIGYKYGSPTPGSVSWPCNKQRGEEYSSSVNVPGHEEWVDSPQKYSSPAPSRRRSCEVPLKVYTVHRRDFRRVVQRLTGAPPAPRRKRLRTVAPPQLLVDRRQLPHPHPGGHPHPPQAYWPVANALQLLQHENAYSSPWLQQHSPVENAFSTEFLSLSSHSPLMLLSPGTMAALEYAAAL